MPKITWCRPKVNHLSVLLKTAKREKHMTDEQIGKLVGSASATVNGHLNKPADKWTIGQIKLYCNALGIPYDEAVLAAVQK